ncbi:hypothetical protein Bca4012_010431 [Brassica carinata]
MGGVWIRVQERASIHALGDIPVYEAFFETGFRGVVPALIVGLCDLSKISPSQLKPPAWRILIAIQNLGDLEYLSFVINKVVFAYNLAPLNGGKGRLYLRPRSGMPIIEELPKTDWNSSCSLRRRKHSSPGSSASSDRRQVDILVGSAADDSFAAYQEAAKVISAKRGSASRKVSGNDVVVTSSRRATMVKTEPTSSSQGRNTRGGRVMTRASHQSADMGRSVGTLAKALTNLNLSVFPRDGTILPVGDTSEVIQALQGGLLRTVTRLFHLGERLSTEDASFVREDLEALKREASEEKYRRMAPELEIRDLKEKLKASEKIAEEASTDALATSQDNKKLAKDIKTAAENFKIEMVMAALDQYKAVVLGEAKNKGIAPPSFDDEPAVPSSYEMDVESSARP